uniref:Uncharacterized protein n=1 Tax=Echeneis naucrates TaxID=173247 RepID=A0A665V249_ECHNA
LDKATDHTGESSVAILFCPITSRFETDISAALSDTAGKTYLQRHKVIVVAMHHTFDPDYTLPNSRVAMAPIALLVDCLFYEGEGLLRCDRNKKAYQAVRKEVITRYTLFSLKNEKSALWAWTSHTGHGNLLLCMCMTIKFD